MNKNEAFAQVAEDILMNYRVHPKTVTKLFGEIWGKELRTRFEKH